MVKFNAQKALSRTFYQALHRYHEGGLTNGGGIAGLQRPNLDRFDASGTTLIKSDEPSLQPQPGDWKDPKELTKWNKVNGKWKPTFTAPPEDKALEPFFEGLSDKLSRQSGMTYIVPDYLDGKIDAGLVSRAQEGFAKENYPSDIRDESPELQVLREQIRGDIAKAAASTVSKDPHNYLQVALGMIKDERVKKAVSLAVKDAETDTDGGQSEFFQAPSSSSGKFHPADEINVGGLSLHSLRDVVMGAKLCDIYNVAGLERDEILGALAVHDIEKGGAPWNGYAGDHGPLGQQYLDSIWKVDPSTPDDVAHPERHMAVLVGRHMAQWNTEAPPEGKKYGEKAPLPPRNIDEQLVSWADYLGALDNVYLSV
jgi:hypothetical protein